MISFICSISSHVIKFTKWLNPHNFETCVIYVCIFYRVAAQCYHHKLWCTNIWRDLQPDLYC